MWSGFVILEFRRAVSFWRLVRLEVGGRVGESDIVQLSFWNEGCFRARIDIFKVNVIK